MAFHPAPTVLASLSLMVFAAAASPVLADCQPSGLSDDERLTILFEAPESPDGIPDYQAMQDQIPDRFRKLWCDSEYAEGLQEASDATVEIRLRAADTTSFYTPRDWILDRHRAALDEARARALVEPDAYRELATAYQAAGDLERARQLATEFPDAGIPEAPELEPISRSLADDQHLIWRIDTARTRLVGTGIARAEPRLVITSSPGCGFCQQAATALLGDETLAPLMEHHALWLAERRAGNTFHNLASWNARHSGAPTYLVDSTDDWPYADFSLTPGFHFVRDNQPVRSFQGWQGGSDSLQTIAEGFAELGLLDIDTLDDEVFAYADQASQSRGCPARDQALESINAEAAITSEADLADHLEAIAEGADSPLNALSTEGRKRLMQSIRFGGRGVAGFRHDDLEAQLDPEAIYQVTSLFGMQHMYAGFLFDADQLNERERKLVRMLECRDQEPSAEP